MIYLKCKKQIIYFEFMFDHYYHLKKLCKLFLPLALETNLQIDILLTQWTTKKMFQLGRKQEY